MADLPSRADVVVVGSGIVGASTAYFLARSNARVVLLDRSGPASEASGKNAGMIGESGGDPATTMQLQRASVAIYEELVHDTGVDIELVMGGRLRPAITSSEVASFEALVQRSQQAGVEAHMLHGSEVRELEPALAECVPGAAWFPGDGKLHPAKATGAFSHAAETCGATILNGVRVMEITHASDRVTGVMTDAGQILASQVILAAGAWTPALAARAGIHVPVFPGKGHMLATEPMPPVTDRVLRAEKLGTRQLANGEMLVGSEIEFVGYDTSVNPKTIDAYLHFMQELVPALQGARIRRTWGCLRPMSIDLLPIIGPARKLAGVYLNTGHGRSGMGLGPASSRALVDTLLTGHADVDLVPYRPDRFGDV